MDFFNAALRQVTSMFQPSAPSAPSPAAKAIAPAPAPAQFRLPTDQLNLSSSRAVANTPLVSNNAGSLQSAAPARPWWQLW